MHHSDSIANLAAALAQAQGEFLVPKKSHTATVQTRTGGTYTYDYSTLDELLAATRPALTAHALAAVQNVTTQNGTIAVATVLLHESGEYFEFDPVVMTAGETPQAVGAAITYARRYSLGAALNVAAEEDEDAQTVTTADEDRPRRPPPTDRTPAEDRDRLPVVVPFSDVPPGFHYVDGYNGPDEHSEWYEATLMKWAADGSGLRVSTKLPGVGKLLAKAAERRLPIKTGITPKKNRPGEAYLNKVQFYDAEQTDEPA